MADERGQGGKDVDPVVPDVNDDLLFRRISWRLLPFLMLCYTVAYLDRVNVGFAKSGMSRDLGLSDAAYGLGAGIFFIGYFLFEVPSNLMLHRVGARRWIARIMVSWSLLSAACAFVQEPVAFFVLRFLLGVAEAGFFPGVILYLTFWYPQARRGQIVATFMVAIPAAGLIGGPLSGLLLDSLDGAAGWGGWRWMFVIEAVPALVLGLLVPIILSSRAADARWLSAEQQDRLAVLLRAGQSDVPGPERLADLVRNPKMLRFAAIYFACMTGQYGISFWLPALLAQASGGSALRVGILSALPYACAIVAMILMGWRSDRTGERRWHIAVTLLTGAAGFLLLSLPGVGFEVSFVLMCIATAGALSAAPLFWNLPTSELRGVAAAAGIAAINSVGNFAGFVSPFVIGWVNVRTGTPQAGLVLLGAALLAGAALVLATGRRRGGRQSAIPDAAGGERR